MFESRAIVGYLDAVFKGKRLIPAEPVLAAEVEQLSDRDETRPFLSSSRLGEYLTEQRYRPGFGATEPPAG